MAGKLTFEELKQAVAAGEIDTVLAVQVDMQGRLMGKRFQAEFFCESAWEETHSCNYLQATDMEMETVGGYKATSWEAGYGDYAMKPDLSTLRRLPWLEATAMVICDLIDHHTHEPVPHSPRQILKAQMERAAAMGSAPFVCASSMRRTSADPTMTASACSETARTCSGEEIPNPHASGRSVTARSDSTRDRTSGASDCSPVMPVRASM